MDLAGSWEGVCLLSEGQRGEVGDDRVLGHSKRERPFAEGQKTCLDLGECLGWILMCGDARGGEKFSRA